MIYKTLGIGGDYTSIYDAMVYVNTVPSTETVVIDLISSLSTQTNIAMSIKSGQNITFTCTLNKSVKDFNNWYYIEFSSVVSSAAFVISGNTTNRPIFTVEYLRIKNGGTGALLIGLRKNDSQFTVCTLKNCFLEGRLLPVPGRVQLFYGYCNLGDTYLYNNVLHEVGGGSVVAEAVGTIDATYHNYIVNNSFINGYATNIFTFPLTLNRRCNQWYIKGNYLSCALTVSKLLGDINVESYCGYNYSDQTETSLLFLNNPTNVDDYNVEGDLYTVSIGNSDLFYVRKSGMLYRSNSFPSSFQYDIFNSKRIFPYALGAVSPVRLQDLMPII